MSDNSPKIY